MSNRRIFSRSLIMLTLALGLVWGGLTALPCYAAGLEELKVSYSPMPLNVPTIVSKKEDMLDKAFKAEGIDVKYLTFLAGPQMTEAMAAKSLDIATVMGATSAIGARSAGVDLKVVAAYSVAPQGFAVVVPFDSKINKVSELKGKKVGAPKGTAAHQLLARVLETGGLAIKDIEFLNMQVPDAGSALVAKQIDVGVLVEPVLTKLIEAKKVRVLKDGTGMIGGLTVITARGDLVRQNPELLRKYLKVHASSLSWIKDNQSKTVDMVAEETGLTKDQVRKLMPKYDFNPALRPEVIDELKSCIDFMYELGMTKKKIDLSDLVQTGLLGK